MNRRRATAVALLVGVLAPVCAFGAAGAADTPPPSPTADEARDTAREILDQRRFSGKEESGGPIEWVGRRVGDGVRRLLDRLPEPSSGDRGGGAGGLLEIVVWAVLAALVVVAVVAIARAIAKRGRRDRHEDDGEEAAVEDGDLGEYEHERDPDRLERAADEAEERGEYSLAIRLRFRAGLLRLDDVGAIEFRPSLTTGQVARTLRSRTFDGVGVTFDEVAYGGRAAGSPEAGMARDGWRSVLEEVGTR